MKMISYYPAKLLVKNEPKPYTLDNGTKGTSYKVVIMNGEDVNTFAIDEETYKKVEPMKDYLFETTTTTSTYNNQPTVKVKLGIAYEMDLPKALEKANKL